MLLDREVLHLDHQLQPQHPIGRPSFMGPCTTGNSSTEKFMDGSPMN